MQAERQGRGHEPRGAGGPWNLKRARHHCHLEPQGCRAARLTSRTVGASQCCLKTVGQRQWSRQPRETNTLTHCVSSSEFSAQNEATLSSLLTLERHP